MYKNKKAQSALEYLLIIGGALLIAVIVITLILTLGRSNNKTATDSQHSFDLIVDNTIIPPVINDIECDRNLITIYTAGSPVTVASYMYSIDENDFENVTLIDMNNKLITVDRVTSPLTIGETYQIELIAIKNNLRSTPTIPFNCKVE
jgi:uncharacterized protein (UPF0333 family)